jgi:hypothetical protein
LSALAMTVSAAIAITGLKIARRERVAQIAQIIGKECLHQSEVGTQRDFKQIGLAVHIDRLLTLLDGRAEACLRQNATEPMPAAAYSLDECSLRYELDLQFAGHHLALGFGIKTNMAHDDLAHKFCLNELADSLARDSGVIGDHGEIALILAQDLVDDALWRAHGHETADHQACTIWDHRNRLIERKGSHIRGVNSSFR